MEQTNQQIEVVFFDIGGVLSAPAVSFTYETMVGEGKEIDKSEYRKLMHEWRLLTGKQGTLKNLIEDQYLHLGLNHEGLLEVFGRLPIYEENLALVERLREGKIKTGIISDQFAESAQSLRERISRFNLLFNPVIFSHESGLTKLTKEIFEVVAGEIKINPLNLLMVDDNYDNIMSAESAGWNILHYNHSTDSLEDGLRSYGLL